MLCPAGRRFIDISVPVKPMLSFNVTRLKSWSEPYRNRLYFFVCVSIVSSFLVTCIMQVTNHNTLTFILQVSMVYLLREERKDAFDLPCSLLSGYPGRSLDHAHCSRSFARSEKIQGLP